MAAEEIENFLPSSIRFDTRPPINRKNKGNWHQTYHKTNDRETVQNGVNCKEAREI
jgi:hypothetical protein